MRGWAQYQSARGRCRHAAAAGTSLNRPTNQAPTCGSSPARAVHAERGSLPPPRRKLAFNRELAASINSGLQKMAEARDDINRMKVG